MADKTFNLLTQLSLNDADFKKGVDSVKANVKNLITGVEGATGNINEMRRALMSLKNVSFAGKSVEEIKAINQQIGNLTDDIGDLKSQQKAMGMEFGSLAAKGLQAFGAIVEAGMGVAVMFGASEENAKKYQAVMTGMIGVMQALGVIQSVIEEKLIQSIALKLKDTAQTIAQSVATGAATAAQWALNASMLVLIGTIGAVVVVVAALVAGLYLLISGHNEAAKAAEEQELAEYQLNRTIEEGRLANDQMLKLARARGASATELKQLELGATYQTLQALADKYNKEVAWANEGNVRTKEQQKAHEELGKQITETSNAIDVMKVELETLGKTSKTTSKGMVKDAREVKDSWVEAYEKAQYLQQFDVPQRSGLETDVKTTASPKTNILQNNITANFIENLKIRHDAFIKNQKDELSAAQEGARKLLEIEKLKNAQKIDALSNTFSLAAGLFEENTIAYKAFAIAQATMDTYKAANMALGSAPPPFNFILMAATIASGIANVGKIAGAFAYGGIVGGSYSTGDRVPIMVNSGEMILNSGQQGNLFKMINSGGSGGGREVEFKIRGTELVGVLSNYSKKINNTR